MATNNIKTKILLANDTLTAWETGSRVLGKGELAIATNDGKFQVRVGTGAEDCTWAKALPIEIDPAVLSAITLQADKIAFGDDSDVSAELTKLEGGVDVEGSVAQQISAALSVLDYDGGAAAAGKFATKITETDGVISAEYAQVSADQVQYVEGKTVKDAIDSILEGDNSVSSQISAALSVLDYIDTAVEHQFVTKVTETDGVISVERAALTSADIPVVPQSKVENLEADLGVISTAVDNKVKVDGVSADTLNVVHISQDEYHTLVEGGNALSNTVYIVSCENFNMYDKKIINLSAPEADTDAANKKYVDDSVAKAQGNVTELSGKVITLSGEVNAVSVALSTDYVNKIATAKTEAISTVQGTEADLSTAATVAGAKKYTDQKITDLQAASTITMTSAAGTADGVLTTYTIEQGGTKIGTIDIPKDKVVKSGQVVFGVLNADGTFTAHAEGDETNAKCKYYIKLTLENVEDPIYVPVPDVVSNYTFVDSTTVDLTVAEVNGAMQISADVKAKSIGAEHLTEDLSAFIQDNRDAIKALSGEGEGSVKKQIEDLSAALSGEIDSLSNEIFDTGGLKDQLSDEIESLSAALSGEIQTLSTSLSTTVDTISAGFDARIDTLEAATVSAVTINNVKVTVANNEIVFAETIFDCGNATEPTMA